MRALCQKSVLVLTTVALTLCAACIPFGGQQRNAGPTPRNAIEALVISEASRYGIDPALVKAIIWKESRFNTNARGAAGELGLMQVLGPAITDWTRATGRRRPSWREMTTPERNIEIGTWYLAQRFRDFSDYHQQTALAVLAYNAGAGATKRWLKGADPKSLNRLLSRIPEAGPRRYVQEVMRRYERYQEDFHDDS